MISLKLLEEVTPKEVKLLAKWRTQVQSIWHEDFEVTYKGTEKWIKEIIEDPKKAFFLIIKDNREIGQIGYERIGKKSVRIGYVIRGEGRHDGSMSYAMRTLIKLAQGKKVNIKVRDDNYHAIAFYRHLRFFITKFIKDYILMTYVPDLRQYRQAKYS